MAVDLEEALKIVAFGLQGEGGKCYSFMDLKNQEPG